MGEPYFKCREELTKNGVAVFSSNYELYGDLSDRVMNTLHTFTDDIEIYSIDEAFLHLTDDSHNIALAHEIRDTVRRWTRIPVSIGLGATKVLAKAASHIAKQNPAHNGVFMLTPNNVDTELSTFPVGELWGIGRQSAMLLWKHRINTALELKNQPDDWIKKKLTVRGLELVYELRGTSCFKLDDAPAPKKGITCSRSFGTPVTKLNELEEAVATYITRGAEKLRQEKQVAAYMSVYIRTSRFTKAARYGASDRVFLPIATAFTPDLLKAGLPLVKKLFRPGYAYAKAGVHFFDLRPEKTVQQNLFTANEPEKEKRLMRSVDYLNHRFGSSGITYAAMGTRQAWRMKRGFVSPRFTTSLTELPRAR